MSYMSTFKVSFRPVIVPLITIVTASFMLIGCASKWEHPIKNEKDFAEDKYKCEKESATLYPPLILYSPFQAGYTASPARYYPYGFGYFSRGYYYPSLYMMPEDYNEANRKKAFQSCLNALGWEWEFRW
ncbi:hypothetical protein [Sulfuricurvum sp.]|uniref:hypothetical protein n=1 Tax=Sulfuricurvum sp. TaxID=2025608 RepID=UPI002625C37B|nr:hypothetical protein [Sulfuricurvum sp.]MDD2266238.1 hypothetical protein [Sulfuricurvum sp.]MDD2783651.1 hypothetical protein [Sulfuricurvum sp.]